jgi:site-specific recombinase XerD
MGETSGAPRMSSNPGITVESVWLSALRAQGRSPKTLVTYEHAVRQLREWRQADPDLSTLTRLEALAFVRHLGERFQSGGVATRVRSLRAMYSWLLSEELVTSNPFARITVSVPREANPTASAE